MTLILCSWQPLSTLKNRVPARSRKLHPLHRVDLYPIQDLECHAPLTQAKDNIWFKQSPSGHCKLAEVVPRLMKSAGIPGYFTNQSLRVLLPHGSMMPMWMRLPSWNVLAIDLWMGFELTNEPAISSRNCPQVSLTKHAPRRPKQNKDRPQRSFQLHDSWTEFWECFTFHYQLQLRTLTVIIQYCSYCDMVYSHTCTAVFT